MKLTNRSFFSAYFMIVLVQDVKRERAWPCKNCTAKLAYAMPVLGFSHYYLKLRGPVIR
jgi:hypothetical protein